MSESGRGELPVADEADTGAGTGGRRGWLLGGVVALAVVAVVAVVVVLVVPSDPTYDDSTRQRFLDACIADGGDAVRPACECLYSSISETIPFDRFAEIDEDLTRAREVGEPIVLPDDVAELLPACRIPA